MRKIEILLLLLLLISLSSSEMNRTTFAKYEPPDGKVLVFLGQDNEAMGSNDASQLDPPGEQIWENGYMDHFYPVLGAPAGITHYVYMTEGKENAFGRKFEPGSVYGLNSVVEWAAGDMCLRCYLDNPREVYKGTIIHLSISMEFDSEDDIAAGKSDHLIQEVGDFLEEFSEYPFMIRIGYEFDGAWNNYDSTNYKKAFIRMVDHWQGRGIENFATVMASSSQFVKEEIWNAYYPGDSYVDWVGYSFFDPGAKDDAPALNFARKHRKPVMIAEATPFKKTDMKKDKGDKLWKNWFVPLFDHIEANQDVIKALCYINSEWIKHEMWNKSDVFRIDTRLQENEELTELWINKMKEVQYIHSTEGLYELIGHKDK